MRESLLDLELSKDLNLFLHVPISFLWEYIFQAYVSFLQTVGNTNVVLAKQAASDSFVDSCHTVTALNPTLLKRGISQGRIKTY